MKLSKKIVSMILVAAMVIAQVSVLPLASEDYSSGLGDSASYALKVPDLESVGYGDSHQQGAGAWVVSSSTLGRNDANDGYASDVKGNIFITGGEEKFFVLTPSAEDDYVVFRNAPANTYTSGTALFNGIPSSIKANGFAIRLKGAATAADKLVIDLALTNKRGTEVAYTAKSGILFIDAKTGTVSDVSYSDNGIELSGLVDGWLYVSFAGLVDGNNKALKENYVDFAKNADSYNPNNTGYKGIKISFTTDDYLNKTLYVGNAMFVESLESFRKVHGSPEAPALESVTENSITVKAVDGVEFSIDGANWSTKNTFTDLKDGMRYTIYARYVGKTGVSSASFVTNGVRYPEAIEVTIDTIKVEVIEGQEYSIGGAEWNTTGIFTDLNANTGYRVTTRLIGSSDLKYSVISTARYPYASVKDEGAYYALTIPEGITKLTGSYGSSSGSVSALPVEQINGMKYVVIAPTDATEGVATIGATALTYGTATYGIPDEMVKYELFLGFAIKVKVDGGTEGTVSKFKLVNFVNNNIQNGDYTFLDATDGSVSTITYSGGFVVDGALDGWIVIPFDNIKNSKREVLTPDAVRAIYKNLEFTLLGSDKGSDWTGRTLSVGTALFYTDYVALEKAYTIPETTQLVTRDRQSITINAVEGVEYAITLKGEAVTEKTKWQTTGKFSGLTVDTAYVIHSRYLNRTRCNELEVRTRLASTTLVAPTLADIEVTETTITVKNAPADHFYSIDGGVTWHEYGKIAGIAPGGEYNLTTMIFEGTETSEPLTVVTPGTKYSTGKGDGASYFLKVPTPADTATNENGEYMAKALNSSSWWSANFAVDRNTLLNVGSEGEGVLFIESIDGERFIKITPGGEANGYLTTNMTVNGEKYYGGIKGIPDEIPYENIQAFAYRIAVKGGEEGQASAFDMYLSCPSQTRSNRNATAFTFIDAKTGEISQLEYSNGIKVTGELNGWVIIPLEAYAEDIDIYRTNLKAMFTGPQVFLHHLDQCNDTHAAKYSDWTGRSLYVGDSVFLSNVNDFIKENARPNTPELLEKDCYSVSVVTTPNMEYAIDLDKDGNPDWDKATRSGKFENLKADTEYSIYGRYINGAVVSYALVVTTDMENPPLSTPVLVSKTDAQIVIEAIPGLRYTHDGGKTWTEFGVFDGLDPATVYEIYGVNKLTGAQTAILEVTTVKLPNPYDNGDGSSQYMPMSRYEGSDRYTEYWVGTHAQVAIEEDDGNGGTKTSIFAPIVELDGERFIDLSIKNDPANETNFNLSQINTYKVASGFPRCIWINNSWGLATRIKITGSAGAQTMSFYMNCEGQKGMPGGAYYLIDKTTGTWKKYSSSSNSIVFTESFDGWLMLPFETFYKNVTITPDTIQKSWTSIQIFLRPKEKSDWMNNKIYIADTVVVEDANLFAKKHAPNSENGIVADGYNKVTVPEIPGVMANDCSGSAVNAGLNAITNVVATSVNLKKHYESSAAVGISVSNMASITFVNDALNKRELPQELVDNVITSMGMSFYVYVPERFSNKVGFDVSALESGTENYYFNEDYYYTVTDGVASKNYGPIELKPGFDGVVVLPFDNFNYDATYSTFVDGMLYDIDTLAEFTLSFDTGEYPALSEGSIYVDDFYLYQKLDDFLAYMLKTQGVNEYSIYDNVLTMRKDETELPRSMANDCTSITKEEGIYSVENLELKLIDRTDIIDSYIEIEIGDGASSAMFKSHAYWEDMPDEEWTNLMNSTGVTFWLSVPKEAPMTVGMDLEILESEQEYFWYDPNTYYYTVVDGKVHHVNGYLEFAPGFEGMVVIPLENFFFDVDYSTEIDGALYDLNAVDYFGMYFNTDYYASIGGTKIAVDDFAFCQGNYRFIDAVWASQTGNKITEVDPEYYSSLMTSEFEVIEVTEPQTASSVDVSSMAPIAVVSGLALLAAVVIADRKKRAEEN
ncbi:MAG: hypothetical protein IJ470_01880 [Clostridia bacterium]|nr:hypothetical protein [Clostridia bacterium]